MENLIGLFMGIGLSAACGFRIFVPFFFLSLFAYTGKITLASGFAWLGQDLTLLTLGVATVLEIAAYYIPWVDNLLDTISSPAAVIAGVLVTASCVTGMDPFLQWGLAAIVGGGSAGLVQGTTVIARGLSTAGSGGLTNPIVSTIEAALSVVFSVLAMLLPIVAVLALLAVLVILARMGFKLWKERASAQ